MTGPEAVAYERRRLDGILDARIERIEERLTALESRLNTLFGALGLLVILAQVVAPIIVRVVGVPT